jgi:hypothetical protein
MELATRSARIQPCIATLPTRGKGWVDFIRSIDAITLFSRGFGEIIERVGTLNHYAFWRTLPAAHYLLAATTSDLKEIIDCYGGDSKSDPIELCGGLKWHFPASTLGPC